MYRNKIHDHTNSCLVTLIHKFFQLIRCSITCGRRKKSGILISSQYEYNDSFLHKESEALQAQYKYTSLSALLLFFSRILHGSHRY